MKFNRNWKRVCIKDVCQSIIDCVNKTAPTVEYPTAFKMIRTTNVKSGWVDLSEVKYVTREVFDRWTRRAVPQKGDIILTREAPLGEVGMLRSNDNIFLGQRLVQYRANPKYLNNRYLLYAFQEHDLQAQIKALGSGSTVEHMRVPDAEKLTLLLPPLPTQHKTASILSAYDDLIENNTQRIAILEEMAQSIYQEWFVRFRYPGHEEDKMVESELGMIPEGWKTKNLGDLCHITMGQSPSSQFYNENGDGLPFHQGVTNFGKYFPTDHMYCSVENRIAEAGDILFSVRAPVGRINVSNKKIVIGRGLSAIRSKNENQTFILYQLKEQFQKEDTIGNGAIFKSVTKDDMHNINLLLPADDIVSLFEEYTQPILKNIEILTRKNINLRNTRDLLLPKLISGEIDVEALDIAIPDLIEPEAQQQEAVIARPEPIDATQLALPLS